MLLSNIIRVKEWAPTGSEMEIASWNYEMVILFHVANGTIAIPSHKMSRCLDSELDFSAMTRAVIKLLFVKLFSLRNSIELN